MTTNLYIVRPNLVSWETHYIPNCASYTPQILKAYIYILRPETQSIVSHFRASANLNLLNRKPCIGFLSSRLASFTTF